MGKVFDSIQDAIRDIHDGATLLLAVLDSVGFQKI